MPPLLETDDNSDVDIPANGLAAPVDSQGDDEADAQLKDDLMSDVEEEKVSKTRAKRGKKATPPPASGAEAEADEEEEAADSEWEVEEVRTHEWRRKGKYKPWILLYNVKWKGYPDDQNTLEPEENLLGSKDLLIKYWDKIGGMPQPPAAAVPPAKLGKKKSTKSLREGSRASTAEDSPAPSAKRQKRSAGQDSIDSDNDNENNAYGYSEWVPGKKTDWEKQIKEIQTAERDPKTDDLYILTVFKNGKKSRVKHTVMRQNAPQKLLDFYEAHLNFSAAVSM